MNDNKKFTYIMGQALGTILATCVAICLGGIVVALTVKFLTLIF